MIDLYRELRELIQSLTKAGAQFALCGGLAVAVHGKVRATIDIDLLVPAEDLEKVEGVSQAARGANDLLPRRLIYIVNRRTVVDQATTVTETLRRRLLGLEPLSSLADAVLEPIRQSLEKLRAFSSGPAATRCSEADRLADRNDSRSRTRRSRQLESRLSRLSRG